MGRANLGGQPGGGSPSFLGLQCSCLQMRRQSWPISEPLHLCHSLFGASSESTSPRPMSSESFVREGRAHGGHPLGSRQADPGTTVKSPICQLLSEHHPIHRLGVSRDYSVSLP